MTRPLLLVLAGEQSLDYSDLRVGDMVTDKPVSQRDYRADSAAIRDAAACVVAALAAGVAPPDPARIVGSCGRQSRRGVLGVNGKV